MFLVFVYFVVTAWAGSPECDLDLWCSHLGWNVAAVVQCDLELVASMHDLELVASMHDLELVASMHDLELVASMHDLELVAKIQLLENELM